MFDSADAGRHAAQDYSHTLSLHTAVHFKIFVCISLQKKPRILQSLKHGKSTFTDPPHTYLYIHLYTQLTVNKSLSLVKVAQIRAVIFELFTGNNGGGSNSCQVKELV